MYELIIKQNKKINIRFPLYEKITFGLSFLLTIFFAVCLFINNTKNKEDINLYAVIIALNFPRDKKKNEVYKVEDKNLDLAVIIVTSIFYLGIVIYTFGIVIMIQSFIRKRENLGNMEEDRFSENKFRQKTFKLKSFKNKIFQYPIIGLGFVMPLLIFLIIEFQYKRQWESTDKLSNAENDQNDQGSLDELRARFIFYNINCFLNSIRGWLYFKIFISNEKIKIFLFKNYLTSSIFYTINKINNDREISYSRNESLTSQQIQNGEEPILDDSFESSKSGTNLGDDKNDEKKELFEMNKDGDNEENDNDSDDDDKHIINPNQSQD